jgi:hypothetical protein
MLVLTTAAICGCSKPNPLLKSQYAVMCQAWVKGIQAADQPMPKGMTPEEAVIACIKQNEADDPRKQKITPATNY